MERESAKMNAVEREEVQLVSRNERIPSIRVESFTPREGQKGLRFRSYYHLEQVHKFQVQYLRQLYYDVWRNHPWVRALINKIAFFACTVGFNIVYEGEGKSNPVIRKQMHDFFEYPNYQQSWPDILWKTVTQLKIFGESFWEIVKSKEGYPVDFYTLDGAVLLFLDKHGNPEKPAYVQAVMGETAVFNFDEVIRFSFPDPMGFVHPTSDLESLEMEVLVDVYAMQLNKAMFTQGVRKGKAFVFPSDTGPEEMKRNRAEVRTLHEGVIGAYSSFIALEGECKIEDLELQETKMEAKELREYLRNEMSAVIGAPLSKLGVVGNQKEESEYIDKAFVSEVIQPYLDLIQNAINRYLDLVGIQDYRFRFKRFPVRDLKEYARIIDVLKKHGIASINDLREMIGLKRLESDSCDKLFYIASDGTIVFTTDLEAEKVRIDKMQELEAKSGSFTFNKNRRRVIRKTQMKDEIDGGTDVEEEVFGSDPFL